MSQLSLVRSLQPAVGTAPVPEELPVIDSPVQLHPGEVLYARACAVGWWFGATAVEYDELAPPPAVGAAGPPGLIGFSTLLRSRRAQAEAEANAQPQWRPLGAVEVYVTSERLLVDAADGWYSFWYVEGFRLLETASAEQVCASTDALEPFLLEAQTMPYLLAVLSHLIDVEHVGAVRADTTAVRRVPAALPPM